jgi:hypothetical protein
VTDIKPLNVPRPRPYNNNNNNNNNNNRGGCNKARREDTFQKEERPVERPVVIKQEKPQRPVVVKEEERVPQRPILRDNNPKIEVPPPVQYDEAVIASTKKRVIIIRKEPKKETV